MPKTFYLTTAIDYTNAGPHIGHAYEKILADVLARYHRLKGDTVFFLTGVDQHGQKVQQSAERAGIPPQQFVDQITEKFVALWDKLDVRYDGWAATTDPIHKECVQGILQRLFDEKQIYKDKQEGYYSIRQEQFLTDKERGPDGEFGPEWGEVEHRVEENYYFKLVTHKQWLLQFIKSQTLKPIEERFIIPNSRRTELENAVYKLTGDLCISRPKSRLSWGIELPFDSEYVTYVWFDALTNYISFIGYNPAARSFAEQSDEFKTSWATALHIIGKDILIPAHGIYWMIMLHSLGFPDEAMPRFLVHGWWNISGAKMSKSLGNVVDPNELADKYGPEALRYYLMLVVTGQDADFEEERIVQAYNTWLANSIGNLLSRSLNMLHRYFEGHLPINFDKARQNEPTELLFIDHADADSAAEGGTYRYFMERNDPYGALQTLEVAARECNELIEKRKPWVLAKDSNRRTELASVLVLLIEALRLIAIRLSPVLPRAAHGIFDQLNWKMEPELRGKENRFSLGDAEWGQLPDGHIVGQPTPLFPRIEVPAENA
ncbi:MAG TPA: class I tRNA ligase family protein [Chthoniobacterales bacterium]|jgi:methionyl-tRNA synthetase